MSAPMNIQHRRTPSMTCFAPQPTHARSLSGQFGASWSDPFDFSCSPLSSALHLGTSPPMGNAYLPSSCATLSMSCSPRGDYFTFERDYCSNFACCGINLPDMHALVAHFEETHLAASMGAPFTTYPSGPSGRSGISLPQAKPVPLVNVSTDGGIDTPISSDAPSPNSSVGPETPPPSSFVPAYGFHLNGQQPHLQVQTQICNSSRSNSGSPYPHSPYASSPLSSSGSSASLGLFEQQSQQSEQSSTSGEELEMDMDMDVLMAFDPLDNGAHTPLDSTPPSPLAAPIRPSSVLRAAALKNNGGQPDAQPVCLPPSLFNAPIPSPALLSPNVEKEGSSGKKEKKDRRDREKEKRNSAESPVLADATVAAANAPSGTGGVIRREKSRKAAASAMGSLLGSSSRSSISSSSDESASSSEGYASAAAEKEEKAKEASERPRAERTGRPERVDKSGKRTREKAYKCPKPGCTKSYLNPNGLKYHCAKGTCTFVNGSGPPTPVTPTTPAIPAVNTISVPSTPPMSSSNLSVNQPMTPTSLPSSPVSRNMSAVHSAYEYHQQQVPIIATPVPVNVPRDATTYLYAPSHMR